ncbi:sensor histidine kinase [Melioribacter sp. OK-6-Me]|uniref:sensor histidine kinase n=1 Tax=unclassified Melioribacter TaxID=2627329 RepID=UPI003ED97B5D
MNINLELILILLLLLSLLASILVYFLIKKIKNKSRELENQLNLKLQQLEILNNTLMEEIQLRKETEKKLLEKAEELQQSNRDKDRMFSVISHDLKNPFQGLLSYSEMLYEEFNELDDNVKLEIAKGIRSSTKNIYNLLVNLLEWSRLKTNRMEIEIKEINLYELVQEVYNLHMPNAKKKNIELLNEIDKKAVVQSDEYMLNSIFNNLIGNAIKYSDDGDKVIARCEFNSDTLEISIQDTGVGIPVERLRTLFKPGSNRSTAGTQNESGTGLGLLICKEMIEKLNGKITVESKEGEGTRFTIILPCDHERV